MILMMMSMSASFFVGQKGNGSFCLDPETQQRCGLLWAGWFRIEEKQISSTHCF
jgi:hypothetical protein